MRAATRNLFALLAGLLMTFAAVELPIAAPRVSGPLSAARFELSIDGHQIASFAELVAITSIAAVPTESTTGLGAVPLPSGPFIVVLRRPMTSNIEIAAWHELGILGDPAARRSASLTAYAASGEPVARFHMTEAFPSKLEVTTLRAGASDVLMETVTFTCLFIQRVSV